LCRVARDSVGSSRKQLFVSGSTICSAVCTADVITELAERLDRLTAAGVDPDRIVVDPGIGFAKTSAQSWQLLCRLEELTALGRPILVGVSRKSLLSEVLATGGLRVTPPTPRPLPWARERRSSGEPQPAGLAPALGGVDSSVVHCRPRSATWVRPLGGTGPSRAPRVGQATAPWFVDSKESWRG